MRKLWFPVLAGALLAGGLAVSPASAPAQEKRGDQDSARKEMRAGNVLKLHDIERMVVPQIERGGTIQYLTPEFDSRALAYRLKFIDNSKGQVIWVDVDARSGRIIRVSR